MKRKAKPKVWPYYLVETRTSAGWIPFDGNNNFNSAHALKRMHESAGFCGDSAPKYRVRRYVPEKKR